ncbi:hypothetical protein [Dyadobacter luticola]|uniref:Uncharacterized protein n=1 Tax=Dyadobacter luticola TaxID=1979387 RepID=A0A5R9KZ07_9BACT|nr:hypothetical protein [Dyadobacter luticola]TLV01327.1 hypothetical protein FEN17_17990 [Dyadobacter luticola]
MAWKNISDELKIRLFEKRTSEGIGRQPSCKDDILALNGVVKKANLVPYDDMRVVRPQLEVCSSSYQSGGKWREAQHPTNSALYRVETLESFVTKHFDYFTTYVESPSAFNINPRTQSLNEIFKILTNYYKANHQWMNLSNLVYKYFSYRGFSWWTDDFDHGAEMMPRFFEGEDLNIHNRWILEFAFSVGISSDWLSDWLIFLKLPNVSNLQSKLSIPSVIDAYNQPIFFPQNETQSPKYGIAYDLNERPVPKIREFVMTNVPSVEIEFIPVRIDLSSIDSISPFARLTDSLIENLLETFTA